MNMTRRGFAVGSLALATAAGARRSRAAEKEVVIGLSNGYFGTEWRNQMIAGAEAQFADYKARGLASKLVVRQAGPDVNAQIQDMRNMIREGVSVIMVNANSAAALNGVINEAKRADIPVVSFDQAVTNPYAVNVTVDQYTWGHRYAEWIAQQMQGKGNLVVMDGLPGHPAAEARRKAFGDVFSKSPDLKIVWSGYGYWDQAKAQAVMATVLASQPNIDAVCTEDGMGLGILRAFQSAGRSLPTMTGEAQKGFLTAWKAELDAGHHVNLFAQANPPEISRTALGVAVRIAQGRKLKPLENNTYYYPIHLEVTDANLAQVLDQMGDKPSSYFLGEWLSEADLDRLFV